MVVQLHRLPWAAARYEKSKLIRFDVRNLVKFPLPVLFRMRIEGR